jgi:hypothetical protein
MAAPYTSFTGVRINTFTDLALYKSQILDAIEIDTSQLPVADKALYVQHRAWTIAALAAQAGGNTIKPLLSVKEAEVLVAQGNVTSKQSAYDIANGKDVKDASDMLVIEEYNDLVRITTSLSAEAAIMADEILVFKGTYDANVVLLNWLPPPTDAEILSNLQDLLNKADTEIQSITEQISTITTSSSTYSTFTTRMNMYTNFERLVTQQLDQLDDFLTADGSIDTQEAVVTKLRQDITKALEDYSAIVSSNNDKAVYVKDSYELVVERMTDLSTISTNIGNTMVSAKDIITSKRMGMSYKPVVFLPVKTGAVVGADISLDMSLAKLNEYGFKADAITPARIHLLHDFVWDTAMKRLFWFPAPGNTESNRQIEFKFEVLSTTSLIDGVTVVNSFDTSTVAKVQVYNTEVNNYTAITNNFTKTSTFSSVHNTTQLNTGVPTGTILISILPGQSVGLVFDPLSPQSLKVNEIKRGLISMLIPTMNITIV